MHCGVLPSFLKRPNIAWHTIVNYDAHMFWSFDSLRHLTVKSISKTKRLQKCVVYFL